MAEIHNILQQYWGYPNFRPMQQEIIESVLSGKDTVALLPTGGGKSICYQVPALVKEGLTLVISPLIALMKDQVYQLHRRKINAAAIFSGMSAREIDITLDNCIYGNTKLLYVSPERLQTELFIERLKRMPVNLLAVDESHCISQWGYDFRPPYLKIADIREYIPDVPVMALTASATPEVEADIVDKLEMKNPAIFRQSFYRENLSYSVFKEDDKLGKLKQVLENVRGTAIVYARNRRKTKDVALELRQHKISADFYHAGLSPEQRSKKQEEWINDKTRVMVCTNAFGMGIDKPDVRVVAHLDVPDSPEAYYQEAGRGGRDGKRSYAVVIYHQPDLDHLQEGLDQKFPSLKEVRQVYRALGNYFQLAVGAGEGFSYDFDVIDFIKRYQLDLGKTLNALKLLEEEGHLFLTEAVFLSPRVKVIADRQTLYKFEVENRKLEPLMKLMLRTYEGIFDHYIKINERLLARELQTTVKQVQEDLYRMDRQQVINYEPQKEKPQLTYLTPRLQDENIHLDVKFLKSRKKASLERVLSMQHYAENKVLCRSEFILHYFGEKETSPCGICDICTGRHTTELSEEDYEKLAAYFTEALAKGPIVVQELVKKAPLKHEEKTVSLLRSWLDEGKVHIEKNRVSLKMKKAASD